MKNIVFTGLPGSGKSSLGCWLAEKLNMNFADTDSLIEENTAMFIKKIFKTKGEKYFRDAEAEVIRELSRRNGMVIAIGGGALLRPENAAALKQNGILIFLDRPPENILADLHDESRPLLSGNPENLLKLEAERRGIYEGTADLHYVNNTSEEEAREGLLKLLASRRLLYRFAVIGDPIAHTLSPAIHGAVFKEIKIPAMYSAFRVAKDELKCFVEKAREELEGFNVTIPHKRDIIPLLDEVDEEAALCQAVNTVAVKNGRLIGGNTDMEGLYRAVKSLGGDYKGRTVLIAGTGGAAWAAAFKAAIESAAEIKIAGRRTEQRQELCEALRRRFSARVEDFSFEALAQAADADIFIQATPIGMEGVGGEFPSYDFLDSLRPGALVYDLVYKPARTKLLEEAEKRGIKSGNGLSMLIHQAVRAEELFLNKELPRDICYAAALNAARRKIL